MPDIIEIENGVARHVRREVIAEAPLSDVGPRLVITTPMTTPLMPRSHIAHHYDPTPGHLKLRILAEIPAAIRSIIRNNRRYRLAMPWTYFLFQLSSSDGRTGSWSLSDYYVYHAPTRATTLQHQVIHALLPNVDSSGRICFGSTGANPNQPMADYVDSLVNNWYLSQFNNDLVSGRTIPYPFGGSSWRSWVDATRERGLNSITEWPEWTDTRIPHLTLENILQGNITSTTLPITTVTDEIPELPARPTFGRADEAVTLWTPQQRFRIFRSLQARIEDDPTFIEEPPAPTTPDAQDPFDDGGEPI